MPIRNQIEAIVNSLTISADVQDGDAVIPKFLYGTAKELNVLADDSDFPVVMMYTLQPFDLKYTISNSVDDKISIYLEFLFKTEFGEYTAANEVYIQKAVALVKQFMVKLANYKSNPLLGKYFKVNEGDGARAVPVYNKFDVNTTGVNLTMSVTTRYNENIQP